MVTYLNEVLIHLRQIEWYRFDAIVVWGPTPVFVVIANSSPPATFAAVG
jgi:hypothetical protein